MEYLDVDQGQDNSLRSGVSAPIDISISPHIARRNASARSRSSHASYTPSISSSTYDTQSISESFGNQAEYRTHRRNRSDASVISMMSYAGSEVIMNERNEGPVVFVSVPPKNLVCMLCDKVFTDPVIAKCGHTFCRACVMNAPPQEPCPVHQTPLSKTNVISNLTVHEQIQELPIHCRYGLMETGELGMFETNPEGCPEIMTLADRKTHESVCPFAPAKCPNNPSVCVVKLQKHLDLHLAICPFTPCDHKQKGCSFVGTSEAVQDHLKSCQFESMKGILSESDQRITALTRAMSAKDQEIGFLRSMLAKLSQRMERMENAFEERIDVLDENFVGLSGELNEVLREVSDTQRDVGNLQAKLGMVEDIDLITSTHMFKCKGTFVGHQGPVWALAVHGDDLFSGSSDEAIKVWDVSGSSVKCKRTLTAHRGIIHTICTHAHKVYSGSSDCTIKVWDVESLELLKTLDGHENPVCTLAIANGMLFSGSLKVIKIWDLRTLTEVGELAGLNHWVRALVTTDKFIYAGSYQTISIWSAESKDLCDGRSREIQKIHALTTSGGSVYSICVTDDYIVAGTYEHLIHVWDIKSFKELDTLDGHFGTVYALAFMSQGSSKGRLFSASYDKTIRVWSLDNLTCIQTLVRHQNSVDALVVHRGRLFSGAADSTVKVWQ